MDMKNYIIIAFVLGVVLPSCTFYSPAALNVPKYEKVKEINVGVNMGSTMDFNASYNPVEHLSIISNASYAYNVQNESDDFTMEREFDFHRYQVETGLGYYYNLGERIQHDFYVGYGFGKTATFYDNIFDDEAITSNLSNVFFQSSMIFSGYDDDFDIFLSGKFNNISFNDIEYLVDTNTFFASQPRFFPSSRNYWVAQLGVGLNVHVNYVDLTAQAQFAVSSSPFDGNYPVRPIGLYLGMNVNIEKTFKKNRPVPLN